MKQRKIKPYAGFLADAKKLYGSSLVIHGPYVRNKDNRKFVILTVDGRKITKLYAKVKLEIKLGRLLSRDETVDHKDDDVTNDKFANLQLLSMLDNVSKGHRTGALHTRGAVRYSKSAIGRQKTSERTQGERNNRAKFTNQEARRLRIDFAKGRHTVTDIMKLYDVSDRTVKSLLSGRTYVEAGGPLITLRKKSRRHLGSC